MKQRRLGKTELFVSELCLGAMYFGWKEPKEQSEERLFQFTEAGGNFIDTANMYAEYHKGDKDYYGKDFHKFVDGGSERLIGDWMKKEKNRQKLVVATKLGCRYPGADAGTSAKQIREECEKSLKRLKTDYIDLLYLHIDDRSVPMEESLFALHQLIREGKVRQIGASNFAAWRLAKAQEIARNSGYTEYCCVQQRCSYLRSKPGTDFKNGFGGQVEAGNELFDFAKESGITVLAYSPLLGGYYQNRSKPLLPQYAGADTTARLAVLDQVAKETGLTPAQVVYRYLMQSDPSVLPIAAASTRAQFSETLEALSASLSEEQMKRLHDAKA